MNWNDIGSILGLSLGLALEQAGLWTLPYFAISAQQSTLVSRTELSWTENEHPFSIVTEKNDSEKWTEINGTT